MKKYSRVCAKIDLDAIRYNLDQMYHNLASKAQMAAVIKCDGYGHGAVPIAAAISDLRYLWGYAVATVDEAVVLRKSGITQPILVMGCTFPDQYEEVVKFDLQMTIYTLEAAQAVSQIAASQGREVTVHIKLDTGMGRLGFLIQPDSVDEIEQIAGLPGLSMGGLYTHFAKADEIDKTFTTQQIEQYLWMKEQLLNRGIKFTYYHCSNSAGIIDVKEAHIDLVRAGIATYGLYPSPDVRQEDVDLRPALSLISHVAHVKWVPPGTPVSYGGTYVTTERTRIATVPVGYGDGYPRSLSNKGYVLIRGQRAPILGRVCMDQFMVDVTAIDDVQFGDQITLVGWDGEEHLPVETLSELSGRFNYEFVCDLGKRIPREYLRDGQIIAQVDYFAHIVKE